MLVTRLWLRDRSTTLRLCSQPGLLFVFEESSTVSPRSSSVEFVGTELRVGKHVIVSGTYECSLVKTGPRSACYTSTRRWMCTTSAWMLDKNGNCSETLSLRQGKGLLSDEKVFMSTDISANGVDEVSIADDASDTLFSQQNATCVSMPGKDTAGKGMQDTSLIQRGSSLGSLTVARWENDDIEIGEENAEPGDNGENMDRKAKALTRQEKNTVIELWRHVQDKGWTESIRSFLLKKHSQQRLSCMLISRVMVRLKDVVVASSLFQWVCEHLGHDVFIYHAHLKIVGEAKHFDQMWELLTKMEDKGIEVSYVTFCIMIKACGRAKDPDMAVKVFRRALESGVELNIALYRTLLNSLFLLNLVTEARLLYSRMVQEGLSFDIHTHNSLINGFGMTADIEDVKKSVIVMLKAGIRPNLSSYTTLVSAYCNVGATESAISVLHELKESGLPASATPLNIIIQALTNNGKFDDALEFIANVRTWCLPDAATFTILFNAMVVHKKVSKAIGLFHIMEKEGLTNQWTYVILSNGLRQSIQTKKIQDLLKDLFSKYGYSNANVCHALLHNLTALGQADEAERLFKGIVDAGREPFLGAYTEMISFYCGRKMPNRALELLSQLKEKGLKANMFCYTPIIGALLNAGRVADAKKCHQEMLDDGCESNDITCDHLLRELCKHGMVYDVPEILSTILRKRFSVKEMTFLQLAKCLCMQGKIREMNILFSSLCELGCLPLQKKAVRQALSVMKLMPISVG